MIYDFLFMICVRLVNYHIITNLRESVCPGLLHRQFVLCVNIVFVFTVYRKDTYFMKTTAIFSQNIAPFYFSIRLLHKNP